MPILAAFTPNIWLSLISGAVLVILGVYAARHAEGRGGKLFLAMSACSALVFVSTAAIASVPVPAAKSFWFSVEAVALVLGVTLGTCFTLEYAYPGRLLTRRTMALLAIVPLLTLLLILLNDTLVWRATVIAPDGSVRVRFEAFGAFIFLYTWWLGLINAVAFAWLFIRSPEHRGPAVIMLIGQTLGRILFVLYLFDPLSGTVDLFRLAILMPWMGYAIAINAYRIFDPLPAARSLALEQMREGMIVLDEKWRVASLNPAAAHLLAIPRSAAVGKMFADLLPGYPALAKRLAESAGGPVEVTLTSGGEARTVAVSLTPLRDGRGFQLGHLLMLSDVTDRQLSQARIVEQVRSLAIIDERQRMAHELGDGLAQGLSEVCLQANAARTMLGQTDPADVSACLEGLADLTRRAQGDVFERLLSAPPGPAAERSFFATLREVLLFFTRQYGILVELVVPPELDEAGLGPAVEAELLPVIQDALAASRIYGQARCIYVDFAVLGQTLRVAITDDGAGGPVEGDGLRSMQERAERLGGSLAVIPGGGEGTQVVVLLPVGPLAVPA